MNRYDVGEVRKIVVAMIDTAVGRVCYHVSTRPGMVELADKLRAASGVGIRARLAEALMLELGHATMAAADDPNSETMRAVKRRLRG